MKSNFRALKEWRLLWGCLEAFEKATGIPLAIVPAAPLTKPIAFGAKTNPLCEAIAQTPAGRTLVMRFQQSLLSQASLSGRPRRRRCAIDWYWMAAPVCLNDEPIASLFGGPWLAQKPTVRELKRVGDQLTRLGLGAELSRWLAQYQRAPVISEDQFQAASRLLTVLADHVVELWCQGMLDGPVGEYASLTLVTEFTLAQAVKRMSRAELNQLVRLNPVYFSKLCKKARSVTFEEYYRWVRAHQARETLTNPYRRVDKWPYSAWPESRSGSYSNLHGRVA